MAASSSPKAGIIAGGVVGGVALLVILGLLAFFIRRRHRHPKGTFRIEEGERNTSHIVNVQTTSSSIAPVREARTNVPVSRSPKPTQPDPSTPRVRLSSLTIDRPNENTSASPLDANHPLTPQPNVYGHRRKSSDPQIYHAEDFEVLPISR